MIFCLVKNDLCVAFRACVTDPAVKQGVRNRTCSLPVYQYEAFNPQFKSLECSGDDQRVFHYNASRGVCEAVDYVGCFGTDNIFDTEQRCVEICQGQG